MKKLLIVPSASFLGYATVVWFGGRWLGLQGGELWLFRVLLWLIGLAAAALVVYLMRLRNPAPAVSAGARADDLTGEVQFLVREANQKLAASRSVRSGATQIAGLPLVLVLGDRGSGKTSAVINSGQDPELLAGQVFQDSAVAPTRTANLWLGGGTVFVECGSALTQQPAAFSRLIGLLRARGLANLLGRSAQAARAVVICVDCGEFLAAGAREAALEAARRYQASLGEIARQWGSSLPVYVLFTKLDRVAYFVDFVRNLTHPQAGQLFGATLPVASVRAGSYGQEQNRRLAWSFDELFFALADRRIEYLRLENDPSRLPNIYEFPREFRKLRDPAIGFLLDTGRPSQLRASPFLRGFYFSGIRPVAVEEADRAPAISSPVWEGDIGATRILDGRRDVPQPARSPAAGMTSRVASQWVFLSGFVRNVLLADRVARAASGRDTRAATVRRALLGATAAVLCIWCVGATVSFFKNREVLQAAALSRRTLAAVRPGAGQAPSAGTLAELDRLREVAKQATDNDRHGAPMSYRWGIYPGRPFYENSRGLYCAEFGKFMFADARASLESALRSLPLSPGPNDDYAKPYRMLKAYLMTTSEAPRTEPGFLAGELWDAWLPGRSLPEEQKAVARRQFEFYGAEHASGLCSSRADQTLVAGARSYLLQFKPLPRIYANMLADVARRGKPFAFADPVRAVVDERQVPFPYTKAGFQHMRRNIVDVKSFYDPEPWVLGEAKAAFAEIPEFQRDLQQLYIRDYTGQWQEFLTRAAVPPYAGFPDASRKLEAITTSQSSLLRLFCGVSVNTAVEAAEITKAFQPIHALAPPQTCEAQLNGPSTQQYMTAMASLQFQVDDIAKRPEADARLDSMAAKSAARITAQTLNLPKKAEDLLLDPILQAERLIERKAPDALNARGAEFCRSASAVYGRFPFLSRAEREANVAEFGAVFQPGAGLLWKFYQENLQDLLAQDGQRYVQKPGVKFVARPDFLRFFNAAAGVSRAFYPNNAARPALNFSIQAGQSTDVDSFVLQIGNRSLKGSGNGGERQEFVWSGEDVAVTLTVQAKVGAAPISEKGPWAIFRMLDRAHRVSADGSSYEYDLFSTLGRQGPGGGQKATLRLRVDVPGAPGLLGAMHSGCISRVAQ